MHVAVFQSEADGSAPEERVNKLESALFKLQETIYLYARNCFLAVITWVNY